MCSDVDDDMTYTRVATWWCIGFSSFSVGINFFWEPEPIPNFGSISVTIFFDVTFVETILLMMCHLN